MPAKNTEKENLENQKIVLSARTGDAKSALLKARNAKERKSRRRTITIMDPELGEALFSFEIRPLSEREYERARRKARTKNANGSYQTDISKERAELIYMATVDEDRALWDSKEVREEFDTNFPRDIIDDVLIAGDKIAIVNAIDEISGFSDQKSASIKIVDEVKN